MCVLVCKCAFMHGCESMYMAVIRLSTSKDVERFFFPKGKKHKFSLHLGEQADYHAYELLRKRPDWL